MKFIFISFNLECCKLTVNNMSEFWIITNGTQRKLITKNTEIEHDVEMNIQCINEGYYLTSTEDQNRVGDNIETAVCNYGKWTNEYKCKRSMFSITNKAI